MDGVGREAVGRGVIAANSIGPRCLASLFHQESTWEKIDFGCKVLDDGIVLLIRPS
jgi:hypothetical protein